MKLLFKTLLALGLSTLLIACGNEQAATEAEPALAADMQTSSCDRNCLISLARDYVAALVAHDPSAVALAEDIAFVENVTRMTPGEGLWQTTLTSPDTFAITVPDTQLQQVGFLGVMTRQGEEGEQPIIFAIRLQRGSNGDIVEAEHLVSGVRPEFMGTLQSPRPGLFSEIPAASRLSHDELAAIGMSYYDALDDNDGSLMPFAEDCERHENGMITAGPQAGPGMIPDPERAPVARQCGPQLDSQTFVYIDYIDNRRLVAADPVTGLAMGLSHFRHPMENLPYDVIHTDGSTSQRTAENLPFEPFDLPAAHIFKIGADGMVHEIEAMGFTAPLNSPTGWE